VDRGGHLEEIERTRILRAMAEAVSDGDQYAVTVEQVAGRAGIATAEFHDRFADLEDCFLAAFEWGVRHGRAAMVPAYAGEATWVDGIRAALAALLSVLEEEPALAKLCAVYSLGGGPRVLRRRAEVIAALCEFVDEGRLERAARSEPPELTAEGAVGGVLAIVQTRLLARGPKLEPLTGLLGQLMGLILLPYRGAAVARKELRRSVAAPPNPRRSGRSAVPGASIKLTYRSARVLSAIADRPGVSNREVADRAGIVDQGQISKLLRRLEGIGLIVNVGDVGLRGEPNSWTLTTRGELVEHSVRDRVAELERG
jgi:AcrR family transcriptional regulator